MNEKDLRILSHLRNNSRIRLTKLSRLTQIPVSTIYDRIKQSQRGVIKKHTSLLDFSKLGFNARVNIMIRVIQDHKQNLKDFLLKHHNINTLYKINNGYDFLIEAVFRNIKQLDQFIEILEEKFNIEEKNVYHIVDDIKREHFLSDDKLIKLV